MNLIGRENTINIILSDYAGQMPSLPQQTSKRGAMTIIQPYNVLGGCIKPLSLMLHHQHAAVMLAGCKVLKQ